MNLIPHRTLCTNETLASGTETGSITKTLPPSAPRPIKNAMPRPAWWRVLPEEIASDVAAIKKARVEIIARTPFKYPVYAITYGKALAQQKCVNWPSATGSSRPDIYAANRPQTVMIVAGIHGEEGEGIVLVNNLISLLETGRDRRNVARPHLVELCKKYRLVLLPCVNMDGRSFAPLSLNGCTPDDYAPLHTVLKNGKELRWPELKEFFPIPMNQVAQLGTYYNGNGYNIQLDAAPGNLKTDEARALLRLADRERIDCFVNLHSARETPHIIPPSSLNYPGNIRTVLAIRQKFIKKQRQPEDTKPVRLTNQSDINNAVTLATGAVTLTFEFAALRKEPFDAKLESGYHILEAVLEQGMQNPLADRREVLKDEVKK